MSSRELFTVEKEGIIVEKNPWKFALCQSAKPVYQESLLLSVPRKITCDGERGE
jgi:hypothetical protein